MAFGLERVGWGGAGLLLVTVTLAQAFPVLPGNLVLFQAAAVVPLTASYGVPTADAIAFSIVLQATEVMVGVAIGFVCLLVEGVGFSQLREEAEQEERSRMNDPVDTLGRRLRGRPAQRNGTSTSATTSVNSSTATASWPRRDQPSGGVPAALERPGRRDLPHGPARADGGERRRRRRPAPRTPPAPGPRAAATPTRRAHPVALVPVPWSASPRRPWSQPCPPGATPARLHTMVTEAQRHGNPRAALD